MPSLLYAVGANSKNALRRTNADKHRAVEMLLADEEWGQRSNNWLAEACNVHDELVSKVRAEFCKSEESSGGSSSTSARVGIDGKRYKVKQKIFCDGCQRKGERRDCPACVEARKDAAAAAKAAKDAKAAGRDRLGGLGRSRALSARHGPHPP